MKLYINLIPALAYAIVIFFSNMVGLNGEVAKSSRKQQISQPSMHQEINCQNSFDLVPNNRQSFASNAYRNASMVWKIPYPLTGTDMHSSPVIRRYVLSVYSNYWMD